jgi:hypothetical protein
MVVGEEVQLRQELLRIHRAKRGHLPGIRHVAQHVTYRVRATENLDDGRSIHRIHSLDLVRVGWPLLSRGSAMPTDHRHI